MRQMEGILRSTMNYRLLFLLALFSISTHAQSWSTFLDPSRAIDWTSAGFTIPNYTANCSVQPSLTANSTSAASANTTAIRNALASCDATHNVVNIPAGTYYYQAFQYGSQGHQVIRGAGPMSTTIIPTTASACGSGSSICMISNPQTYGNGSAVLPGGAQQCSWTAGYSKGTTSITLSNCGGKPPLNQTLILDQANDNSDTGGIYLCDNATNGCTVERQSVPSGNGDGRIIGNVTHSLQQVVYVTGVSGSGTGPYTVTISPGIYFDNIRAGQSPGAWWPGFVQNDGIENLSIDHSQVADNTAINIYNCYQCWVKNIRSIKADRDHVWVNQSLNVVVRDSYFYGAQSSLSQSYAVEVEESSNVLVENNIFQQTTNPLMFGQTTGTVVDYNFAINDIYSGGSGQFVQAAYAGHNAGNTMNLWEGNNFVGIWSDSNWGSSFTQTLFRNMLSGWQSGKTANTTPVIIEAWSRGFNVIGNVLGQPGYHNNYQAYANSATAGANMSSAETSIYTLGFTGNTGNGTCVSAPTCDAKVFPSLMRWGNWDTVSSAAQWTSAEASPAAITYMNANFSSSYFGSLAHTLPASLHYSSTPSWWPSGKAWPPVGPDVTSGNIGVCSGGTYAGAQAISSSQCTGGTLSTAWASHVDAIPAQVCYLSQMSGPPDGSGSALSFDASKCYTSSATSGGGPTPPTGLAAAVN